ncbi:Protein required for attachment to host cells [Parasphingorhabdus marina DSM 22363]|uniref:Protein required for attachment to host cells n=1 Tax=Parasphingorhabdus marina DSM 22363 TaxID=1123272 RepID=A0A1N6CQL1_9SPHN|nr:host attachment protein [Parasphingorhabdus marina]SIN60725.1 Protein required for attachment to host cells [Parasphingorhabdus marina DSM 22363]
MLVRKGTKIIAVDGGKLSVFRNVGEAFDPVLELIEEERNPVPRTSELGDDKPGRSFKSRSPRRGAHEQTDLHQKEEDRFAVQAADRIKAMLGEQDDGVILVSAPRMLGMVRKNLPPDTLSQLLAEIPKTFGSGDAEPLARLLKQHQS